VHFREDAFAAAGARQSLSPASRIRADRFGLHLTRPGEASTGLADGSAMNRIDTHLIAAGELRSQRGVAGFR
jgi:hypothetical protein